MKTAIGSQLLAIDKYNIEQTKHLIAINFVLTAYSLQLTAHSSRPGYHELRNIRWIAVFTLQT